MNRKRVFKLNQHAAEIRAPAPSGATHVYKIDAADFVKASKFTWNSRPRSNGTYEAQAYARNGSNTPATLHRLISGAKSGQQVAFIDGDTKNCRRDNLRVYDSLGERLSDFYTCQVPILRGKSNVPHSYESASGTRYQGVFTKDGHTKTKAGFKTIKAAQEWVLSEKAQLCTCSAD